MVAMQHNIFQINFSSLVERKQDDSSMFTYASELIERYFLINFLVKKSTYRVREISSIMDIMTADEIADEMKRLEDVMDDIRPTADGETEASRLDNFLFSRKIDLIYSNMVNLEFKLSNREADLIVQEERQRLNGR
jgi:hypothetical protein